ncbi:MAG: hypothetical protein H0U74_04440 [Bradymonadaceae bacterium]|nr:hypothetical protein [Lujinxingiaceae bacterium]
MNASRHALSSAIALLTLVALFGCESRAVQEGAEGKLQFYYEPADGSTKFGRPLAVGNSLTVFVEGLDDRKIERVVEVKSSDTGVLTARTSERALHGIVLNGVKAGKARIHVSASGPEGGVGDNIEIEVAAVQEVSLKHACTDGANAAYLQSRPAMLAMKRRNGNRDLVGQSATCPVRIEPAALEGGIKCDEAGLHMPGVTQPGAVRVTATAKNARGGIDSLGFQVVTGELIDFLPIEGTLQQNHTTTIDLMPETAVTPHWPVCHAFELSVDIVTPSVCSGKGGERSFNVGREDENKISLRGVAPGNCVFTVMLPELGSSDLWEFSMPVSSAN